MHGSLYYATPCLSIYSYLHITPKFEYQHFHEWIYCSVQIEL